MEIIHISYGGPTVKLKVSGKVELFEMHPYCGPIKLHKQTLDPVHNMWPEGHAFWPVFDKWNKGGQKIDDQGYGIIEPPTNHE
ncbi:hypothetical protein KAR91_62300 [Candidatus Pacearchaeota archaeon]|nr:hypothetical protein [Candidatus Pacearchaeota archaeon]